MKYPYTKQFTCTLMKYPYTKQFTCTLMKYAYRKKCICPPQSNELVVVNPRPFGSMGYCTHQHMYVCLFVCLSVCRYVCLSSHTFSQHIISSMHTWRKVICYIVMALLVCLEAYWRGVTSTNVLGVKMGKTCRPSTHYLINAYV